MQREAWSDVEPVEEKRTEGARFFAAFCSESLCNSADTLSAELSVIPLTRSARLSVIRLALTFSCKPLSGDVRVQSSPRHLLPFWTSRILCCTLNKTQGCVIISNQLHKLT